MLGAKRQKKLRKQVESPSERIVNNVKEIMFYLNEVAYKECFQYENGVIFFQCLCCTFFSEGSCKRINIKKSVKPSLCERK